MDNPVIVCLFEVDQGDKCRMFHGTMTDGVLKRALSINGSNAVFYTEPSAAATNHRILAEWCMEEAKELDLEDQKSIYEAVHPAKFVIMVYV